MSKTISEAVILMAGSGSRLRGADPTFLKPLVHVLRRPLISYTIDTLIHAGMRKITFVVGYQSRRMIAAIKPLVPSGLEPCFVENRDWRKQNGISLLAAADHLVAPFLLTMSDHLFDNTIVSLLINSADPDVLNVAVDRKLGSIFDLDDAMKVQTRDDRVVAIGKDLRTYDAIDTGLFICSREIFDYLERVKQGDDCSLADGVRLMTADNKVHAIDIGDGWWQDVDTPEMLRCAEEKLSAPVKN
jgi:1L-myo-inositol 1-phosphate cytidylyltransferase